MHNLFVEKLCGKTVSKKLALFIFLEFFSVTLLNKRSLRIRTLVIIDPDMNFHVKGFLPNRAVLKVFQQFSSITNPL